MGYRGIPHNRITPIFVGVDCICIGLQGAGSGTLFIGASAIPIGRALLVTGLALQVATFFTFLVVAVTFHRRIRRELGDKLASVRPLFWAFYFSGLLVNGRSLYRVIGTSTPSSFDFVFLSCPPETGMLKLDPTVPPDYLYAHEWPFVCFDAIPILLATIVFLVFHPSSCLPAKKGLKLHEADQDQAELKRIYSSRDNIPPNAVV